MTILEITGSLELIFSDPHSGKPLSAEETSMITEKLQTGEFCITLAQGEVRDVETMRHVADFTFEVLDDTEYNFVEEKED
jgi:hypothetical protein